MAHTSWIESILVILESGGLASTKLHHSSIPTDPKVGNEIVVCIPRPGLSSLHTHDLQEVGRPTIQVISRAEVWETAWDNSQLAHAALKVSNVTVAGVRILGIQPDNTPADGGKDDNDNRLIVFTAQVWLG